MALGDKGMLKLNDPDKFDTQKDLGNNFLGSLVALSVYTLILPAFKKKSAPASSTEVNAELTSKTAH